MQPRQLSTELYAKGEACSAPRMFQGTPEEACFSQLNIYATEQCNRNCSHCWQSKTTGFLAPEVLEKRLQKFPVLPKKISLLGGELSTLPTAVCQEYLDICKQYVEAPTDLSIVTNLHNINDDFFDLLHSGIVVKTSFELGRFSAEDAVLFRETFQTLCQHRVKTIVLSCVTPEVLGQPVERTYRALYYWLNVGLVQFMPLIRKSDPEYYDKVCQFLYELFQKLPLSLRQNTLAMTALLPPGILGPEVGMLKCSSRFVCSVDSKGNIHAGSFLETGESETTLSFIPAEDLDSFIEQLRQLRQTTQQLHQIRCGACKYFQICSSGVVSPEESSLPGSCHGLHNLRSWLLSELK